MTHDQTAPRLLTIGLALLGLGVVLRLIAGERWFDLYGAATVGLVGALPIGATLMRGLERRRRSRWLAALVVLPIIAAGVVQIGYWTAFFSSAKTGVPLGLGRMMLQMNASFVWPLLLVLALAASTFVVWRAIGPPGRKPR
jgi:hypothetical protein